MADWLNCAGLGYLVQVEALRAYAGDKGYQKKSEYLDDGYSGGKLARPGLDKLRDGMPFG